MFHDFHTFDLKVGPLRGFYSSFLNEYFTSFVGGGGLCCLSVPLIYENTPKNTPPSASKTTFPEG